MPDYIKLMLVPICGMLVLLSLIVMAAFKRLIGRIDEMTVEQIRRTKLFATTVLIIVVTSLALISVYLIMVFRLRQ
ncbi:MAG: hypothetical protein IJM79_01665 [Erysipelotrichaceae bacterium]|nr:hypothetical protein [Erysipelotrichaceae bacterium]